ncbi:DUF1273 domain-containing protein [Bacillus alkalicellulosilyticus]|uniref:DUF1273 domain-containing protein n=1 Tax=Alkalihalobacterium alkalicellulosilyticum TaxID=1912214 RepID=UPI0009962AD7|nr:DUF1273 domain-containing protein [Bacillus alkalicellulosilyticus]
MGFVYAVTGYKAHELGIFDQKHKGISYIKQAFKKRIIALLDDGLEWIVISGQLGVELWVGQVVDELRTEGFMIKLGVLTPFLNQEKTWSESNQELYNEILGYADYVDSISKKEYENPMQLRMKNQFIIEKTNGIIILYDEDNEGSPKFYLEEARKKQDQASYDIVYITPDDIDSIIREEQESNLDYW